MPTPRIIDEPLTGELGIREQRPVPVPNARAPQGRAAPPGPEPLSGGDLALGLLASGLAGRDMVGPMRDRRRREFLARQELERERRRANMERVTKVGNVLKQSLEQVEAIPDPETRMAFAQARADGLDEVGVNPAIGNVLRKAGERPALAAELAAVYFPTDAPPPPGSRSAILRDTFLAIAAEDPSRAAEFLLDQTDVLEEEGRERAKAAVVNRVGAFLEYQQTHNAASFERRTRNGLLPLELRALNAETPLDARIPEFALSVVEESPEEFQQLIPGLRTPEVETTRQKEAQKREKIGSPVVLEGPNGERITLRQDQTALFDSLTKQGFNKAASRQEVATVEGGFEGKGARDRQRKELDEAVLAAQNTIDLAGEILGRVRAETQNVPGAVAAGIEEIRSSVEGIVRLAEGQSPDQMLSKAFSQNAADADRAMANVANALGVGEIAEDRAVIQSATQALAFAIAATQNPSGRLTNDDVRRALKQIAADRSPRVIEKVLESVVQRTRRSVEVRLKLAKRRGIDTSGLEDFLEPAPTPAATPAAPGEATTPAAIRSMSLEQLRALGDRQLTDEQAKALRERARELRGGNRR